MDNNRSVEITLDEHVISGSYSPRKIVFDDKNFRRLLRDYYDTFEDDEIALMVGWRKMTYVRLMRGEKQPTIQQIVEFCNFIDLSPAEFFIYEDENGNFD